MTIPLIQNILENQAAFLFILFRVGAFLAAMPLIGGASVPVMVKVMLVISMTFVLFQVMDIQAQPPLTFLSLTLGLLGEVLIGLIMSLAINMLFSAVEMGSEVIGLQMGFGSANLFDPISNKQVSLIARMQGMVAMLIFLAVNGHYILIESLVLSFELIPSSGFYPSGPLIEYLMKLASRIFLIGLKIGIPVIVALLMANVTIGIFARVIPQMNVLLFSFPVTITLGLLIVGLSLPMFVGILTEEITTLRTVFPGLLMRMRP